MIKQCLYFSLKKYVQVFLVLTPILLLSHAVAQGNNEKPDIKKILPSIVRIHVIGEAEDGVINRYGSGFMISEDGLILTAFHTVGINDLGKKIIWKSKEGNPKIEVEIYTNFGLLLKLPVSAVVYGNKVEPDLDIAILKIDGASYPTTNCGFKKIDEQSQVWGLAWRPERNTYDLLEGVLGPTAAEDGARYRLLRMSAFQGNSGGPVIDSSGKVIAIITSGRDGRLVPNSPETFATPLYEFYYMFRPFGLCAPIQVVAGSEELSEPAGFYSLIADLPLKQRIVNARNESFDFRNQHCQEPREISQPIQATQGWKIDPGSIEDNHGKSSMASYTGITDLSETSFKIRARVANNGTCIPLLGIVDGRGSVWGKVSWKEYKDVEVDETKEFATGKLLKGQVVNVDLPPATKNLKVLVTSEDGTRQVFQPGMENPIVSIMGSVESGKIAIGTK